MATSVKNFTINKGLKNEFIMIIKQNDSLLPMVIENSDTFTLKLFNRDTDLMESTLDMDTSKADGYISIYNDANGQIKIVMNSTLTSKLEKERGPKEDRYYLRPTYRIAIECNKLNNGNFVAKIENVYID